MKWKPSHLLQASWFSVLAYGMIRLLCRTYRYTIRNGDGWSLLYQEGRNVLLCMWHQQFFPAFDYFSRHQPPAITIMISRSQDGDIASAIARLGGFRPIRGSSSRGGTAALKTMIRELKQSRLAGHIVDGPQGPAGIVKPGVAAMAKSAQAVVVPLWASADRAWYAQSWDRFMIPKPFSHVTLTFGAPIQPEEMAEGSVEQVRLMIENAMRPFLIAPGSCR
ncbi:MAG: lysophospholipid acyltransferase family protein [Thermodesulfobacteriota bacterium]